VTASGRGGAGHAGRPLAACLGALLLLALTLPLVVLPLAAPAAGIGLVGVGAVVRRGSSGPLARSLGAGALAAGVVLVAVGIWLALAYATGRGTDVESS
jgi:hypothetical protein